MRYANYIPIFNLSRLHLANCDFYNGWKGYELREGGTSKIYKILQIDDKFFLSATVINAVLII